MNTNNTNLSSTPSNKSPYFTKFIVLIIVFILGTSFGVGINTLVNNKKITSTLPQPTQSLVNPTPTPYQIPITEWRTYSNPEYGFQFKYPPTWTYVEEPVNQSEGEIVKLKFNYENSERRVMYFTAYINNPTFGSSAESYLDNFIMIAKKSARGYAPITASFHAIQIGQVKDEDFNVGYEITYGGVDVGQNKIFAENGILFDFSPFVMGLSGEGEFEEISKIVSEMIRTFEFVSSQE